MKSRIFLLVGIAGCVLSGVFLSVATQRIKIREESFIYSDAFRPQIFENSLEDSGYKIRDRIAYDNLGTAYYSGLSSFETVCRVRAQNNDNIEDLENFGETLDRRLQETGASAPGGLLVYFDDHSDEAKFTYSYTIGPRVGTIRIYKLDNYFFYSHIESTNIRGPNVPQG